MRVNWELIKQDYLNCDGNMKLKELAEKHNVNHATLRSRKNREQWDSEITNIVATKKEKQQKNVAAKSKVQVTKENRKLEKAIKELNQTELTEKQKLFCLYYIKNFNATQAYLKAYQCGYDVANVEGYKNLVKPSIKAEIFRLKELKKKSIMLSEDDIVERYMRIAFADMTDFIDFGQEDVPVITKNGVLVDAEGNLIEMKQNVINFKNSNQVDGGLICEIKQSRQGVSIKLEDRQKALKWLADFFEMNPEHKHRKMHDQKKLQLETERFEHTKEMDKLKDW